MAICLKEIGPSPRPGRHGGTTLSNHEDGPRNKLRVNSIWPYVHGLSISIPMSEWRGGVGMDL